MKTFYLFTLLFLLLRIGPVNAQWQVIYPPLPDSLHFIAWGISVVDENIVWVDAKVNIAGPLQYQLRHFAKTVDGGATWPWGEIDAASTGPLYWRSTRLVAVDADNAWDVRYSIITQDTSEVSRPKITLQVMTFPVGSTPKTLSGILGSASA